MVLPLLLSLALHASPLTSTAETSSFTRTGRYPEAVTLCHALAQRYPRKARCTQFGTSPEGRPLLALAVSEDGVLEPARARALHRPVVLFQGGIHAGEIDGKDAGFWLLREVLEGKTLPGVLGKVTAVFVPVFNVDGHERFGKNQRPNQVGPEEMGWRVTAQDLNLNRDYMKVDAPEMTAMLGLLTAWDPMVYLDLHVTDGAQFQPDVSLVFSVMPGETALEAASAALKAKVVPALLAQGHHPVDFYPDFRKENDPLSGFAQGYAPPRFSTSYWALHHRIGLLVETHSWKPYVQRVKTTRDVLEATLTAVAADAAELVKPMHAADERARTEATPVLALDFKPGPRQTKIDFPGYVFHLQQDGVGGPYVAYDTGKPQSWTVPFFPDVTPSVTAQLPGAGYVVPVAWAALVEPRLKAHGIKYTRLGETRTLDVERFHASEVQMAPRSYEGHQSLAVKGAWQKEQREFLKGSLYVPVRQALLPVIGNLLEPQAPDSLLHWGYFNGAFEQKEYIEAYVLEPWVKAFLVAHPEEKATYEQKLKSDAAFAKDPEARLKYFARRHPSWDAELDVYPVARVDVSPGLAP